MTFLIACNKLYWHVFCCFKSNRTYKKIIFNEVIRAIKCLTRYLKSENKKQFCLKFVRILKFSKSVQVHWLYFYEKKFKLLRRM